jgi:hypothetical protein
MAARSTIEPASKAALIRPASSAAFALGLGLTNECNLACVVAQRTPIRRCILVSPRRHTEFTTKSVRTFPTTANCVCVASLHGRHPTLPSSD